MPEGIALPSLGDSDRDIPSHVSDLGDGLVRFPEIPELLGLITHPAGGPGHDPSAVMIEEPDRGGP
jgi:hypothetical protein